MDNFYFKCHQCGKCCNSGPEIEFSEIIEHSKNFPLAVKLRLSRGYDKFPKDVVLGNKEQFVEINDYIVSFQVFGYEYISLNKCSQLMDDGGCGIYEKRPNVCRLVPANIFSREKIKIMSSESYDFFKKEGCVKEFEEDGFESLYENEKLKDKHLKFFDFSKQDKINFKIERVGYISILEELIPSFYKTGQTGYMTVNLVVLLHVLYQRKKITLDEYKLILNNQINILTTVINNAVIRKNKEDVKQTREFKNFIDMYKIGLKNI